MDPSKPHWIWKKWWILLWVVNVLAFSTSWLFLQPKAWAIHAAVSFGLMEGFALWHGIRHFPVKAERYRAPYPPLTYVTRYYLPRWLAYTLTGGLIGAVGFTVTLGLPTPLRGGVPLALFAWLVEHWEVTYREMPKPE